MSTKSPLSTADDVQFFEVGSSHGESLAELLKENNVPAVTRTFNPFPMSAETALKIAHLPRRDRYYGASLEGKMIGLSMLRGWDEGYSVPSFGIIVDHRFHNLGVGSRMLDFTIEQARVLGCSRVRLTVYSSNSPAVRLYKTRGFVECARENVVLMSKPDERVEMILELN
ncbi:MAG: GNAT family N-acetyltransferase [Pyrinomonadaceae bacterium]|jgi:ribosomal protein S18 acetylase RimI-like enzyme|nr:GNAT family N-acetyltransferase [Pyrinomonadaceae bacterium]